jgi:hypothetical protein
MPKSKLKTHHNGHAVTKGKGSIYQRNVVKREEQRETRREVPLAAPVAPEPSS